MGSWSAGSDVLVDVLSRLPTRTLLGMRCVSKEWRRLISDRSLVQLQLKRTELSQPTSGFFYQERFKWCNDDIRFVSYIPADMEGTEVQGRVLDFLPENVVIQGVSNGLICCRSCFPSPYPLIYVCNPISREWVSLPFPVYDSTSSLALAFDPFCDPIDVSTNFKLVNIYEIETEMEDLLFSFDVYSSRTGSWRRSVEICQCRHNLFKNKGLFVKGFLYWLMDGDQILMFDLEHELSWLITVPVPRAEFNSIPEMCIGEFEGQLQYVLLSEDGLLLWVLEDHFGSQWRLKYSIDLEKLEDENPLYLYNTRERIVDRITIDTLPWMDPLTFKDGILFMRVSADIFLFNFETGKMKKLCNLSMLGPNYMASPIVLPYTMSLVPLGKA